MRNSPYRFAFVAWVGLILLIVVPWGSFQVHSYWAKVAWVPFVTGPFRASDAVLNVLLYVPFGYLYVRHAGHDGRHAVWRAFLYAIALSATTEFAQVFSNRRYPTGTDLACNAVGALCGALWARARSDASLGGVVPDPNLDTVAQ